MRHGKTKGNLEGRYLGTTDEHLCALGIKELHGKVYPAVEKIYVSPMNRCMETAESIYPRLPKEIVPDLRECDFGDFENKNYSELQGSKVYQNWIDSKGMLPFPNGETPEAFRQRTTQAFERIIEEVFHEKREKIAIVAHGGTIMSILEKAALNQKAFYEWQLLNGQGYCLNVEETLWKEKKKIRVTGSF